MTEKTLDWLNHNRYRAYPFVNDAGLAADGVRVPNGILLDCTVMDTRRGVGVPELVFTRFDVTAEKVAAEFSYGGRPCRCEFADEESDAGGVHVVDGGSIPGMGGELVYARLVFSSHGRALEDVGQGTWTFTGRVLPSRVVATAASGVMGLATGGSADVEGREAPGVAEGSVVLADGYRTQPVVQGGRVLVKVGTPYGLDPCRHSAEAGQTPSCEGLMLFFCGQNAVNDGNVVVEGGPGVTVSQGRSYTARRDIPDSFGEVGVAAGESVPCIEISAASSLMGIYRPRVQETQEVAG